MIETTNTQAKDQNQRITIGKKGGKGVVEGSDRRLDRGRARSAGGARAGSPLSEKRAPAAEGRDAQMNVHWLLPDQSVLQRNIPDVEQLLFLLRLTGRVSLDGESYRVMHAELVVDENLAVKVVLADGDGEPERADAP